MNDPYIQQWLPVPFMTRLVYDDPEQPGQLRMGKDPYLAMKEKIGEAWGQFAEKETSELQGMKTFLQERREELKERLDSIEVVQPEKSEEGGLPMRLKHWQELPKADRQRLYRKWHATYHEIQFRLGVIENVMWRRSMFDDNRPWFDVDESGDADKLVDETLRGSYSLKKMLLDTDLKMDFIINGLQPLMASEGKTWDELNNLLDEKRKEEGLPRIKGLPYKNGESMSRAVRQYRERNT